MDRAIESLTIFLVKLFYGLFLAFPQQLHDLGVAFLFGPTPRDAPISRRPPRRVGSVAVPTRDLIERMRAQGQEYPQIWHLFAFRQKATEHLARFTQEVLRGPSPLSPGMRELIAAFTSGPLSGTAVLRTVPSGSARLVALNPCR
jgi:hypothetical protein